MSEVYGRIGGFYASSREECFRIRLVDCDNGVPPKSFWTFKDGLLKDGPRPPEGNIGSNRETFFTCALWCAANGFRVTMWTRWDLKKDGYPLTQIGGNC
jgi:hypothetical protein